MSLTLAALEQRREALAFLRHQEDTWNERLMLLNFERCSGGCGKHMCDAVGEERTMLRGMLTSLRRKISQWRKAVDKVSAALEHETHPPATPGPNFLPPEPPAPTPAPGPNFMPPEPPAPAPTPIPAAEPATPLHSPRAVWPEAWPELPAWGSPSPLGVDWLAQLP